jgi:hypothetical protein
MTSFKYLLRFGNPTNNLVQKYGQLRLSEFHNHLLHKLIRVAHQAIFMTIGCDQ